MTAALIFRPQLSTDGDVLLDELTIRENFDD